MTNEYRPTLADLLADELDAEKQRYDSLLQVLRSCVEFADHKTTCSAYGRIRVKCTCGRDTALSLARPLLGEEES